MKIKKLKKRKLKKWKLSTGCLHQLASRPPCRQMP
jgi:hypothetical protein